MNGEVKCFRDILELKRYSYNTIKSYVSIIKRFKHFYSINVLKNVADNQMFEYILHRVSKDKISFSLQKQTVGAIKLFYAEVYKRKINLNYLYPKRKEITRNFK